MTHDVSSEPDDFDRKVFIPQTDVGATLRPDPKPHIAPPSLLRRLELAWNVLLGRPTMTGVWIATDGSSFKIEPAEKGNTLIFNNAFETGRDLTPWPEVDEPTEISAEQFVDQDVT